LVFDNSMTPPGLVAFRVAEFPGDVRLVFDQTLYAKIQEEAETV